MTLENQSDACYVAGGNRGPEVLERTHECDLLLGSIRGRPVSIVFLVVPKRDKKDGVAQKEQDPGGWFWAIKPCIQFSPGFALAMGINGNQWESMGINGFILFSQPKTI